MTFKETALYICLSRSRGAKQHLNFAELQHILALIEKSQHSDCGFCNAIAGKLQRALRKKGIL